MGANARPLLGQGDDEDEIMEKRELGDVSSVAHTHLAGEPLSQPHAALRPSSCWRLSISDTSFIKMAPVLDLGPKPWP